MTKIFQRAIEAIGQRKRTTSKKQFNDRIAIYTAPSGTQSIRIADLLFDKEVEEEINQLNRILKQHRTRY